MTEWDDLTHREQDAMVAEHIFGEDIDFTENGAPYKVVRNVFTETDVRKGVDHFTSRISDAWRVVEEMEEDRYIWRIQQSPPEQSHHRGPSAARFWTYDEGELTDIGRGYKESPAEAICLAALRAKGVDV